MTNDTALNLYLEQCDRIRLAYGRYRQETETARVCAELIAVLTRPEEQRRISYRGEVICRVCDVLIMAEQILRCFGAGREEVSRTIEHGIAREFDRIRDEALRYDP